MLAQDVITYPEAHRSLYRHHEAIRTLLGVRPFTGAAARKEANQIALEASQIVDTRTDVINILVDDLIQKTIAPVKQALKDAAGFAADVAGADWVSAGATASDGRFFGYSTRRSSGATGLGTLVDVGLEVPVRRYWTLAPYLRT